MALEEQVVKKLIEKIKGRGDNDSADKEKNSDS